jgi:type II secretory pathway predicted ATPase ExeA
MMLQPYSPSNLLEYLEHALEQAAAPHLMTSGLKQTVVRHAGGNIRVLNNMAAELLATAAQKELTQMDEKLFLQIFSRQAPIGNRRKKKNNSLKGETNE